MRNLVDQFYVLKHAESATGANRSLKYYCSKLQTQPPPEMDAKSKILDWYLTHIFKITNPAQPSGDEIDIVLEHQHCFPPELVLAFMP